MKHMKYSGIYRNNILVFKTNIYNNASTCWYIWRIALNNPEYYSVLALCKYYTYILVLISHKGLVNVSQKAPAIIDEYILWIILELLLNFSVIKGLI